MRRLTEQERTAMVALRATGIPIAEIARKFNVHRNSVSTITKAARVAIEQNPSDWRERFQQLPAKCVAAIERSIADMENPHKAAATAQTHFKGIGVYNPDIAVNQYAINLQNLPQSVKELCLAVEDAPQSVVPPQDVDPEESGTS